MRRRAGGGARARVRRRAARPAAPYDAFDPDDDLEPFDGDGGAPPGGAAAPANIGAPDALRRT